MPHSEKGDIFEKYSSVFTDMQVFKYILNNGFCRYLAFVLPFYAIFKW